MLCGIYPRKWHWNHRKWGNSDSKNKSVNWFQNEHSCFINSVNSQSYIWIAVITSQFWNFQRDAFLERALHRHDVNLIHFLVMECLLAFISLSQNFSKSESLFWAFVRFHMIKLEISEILKKIWSFLFLSCIKH